MHCRMREPNAGRGIVSFPASERDHVMIRMDSRIFDWFRDHAQPCETAETEIHRVLTGYIAEQMKKAS